MSDDNVTPFPQPTLPEWILPPMEVRNIVLDGRLIPKLTAYKRADGSVSLTLDGRYGLDCADEGIAYVTACFVANALAIGGGWPCYTADDKFKPFAPKCMQLGSIPTRTAPE